MLTHHQLMLRTIQFAKQGMQMRKGGPFGAIIVRNAEIVAVGQNEVLATNDPTAHAEIIAIRKASAELNDFNLSDCVIYCSCEPCPMCLGAIYWARIKEVFFAAKREDAANIGFDDQFIYTEVSKPLEQRRIPFRQFNRKEALKVFQQWDKDENKVMY